MTTAADTAPRRGRAGRLGGAVLAALFLALLAAAPASALPTTMVTSFGLPASSPVGTAVTDKALVTGGDPDPAKRPTGTVTFTAYYPGDTACTGTPVFTDTKPIGTPATSGPFTPAAVGLYKFKVAYSGDANNAPSDDGCGATAETVNATAVTPTLTTAATASVPVGGMISDTATLTGGYKPGGKITFVLYGTDDPTCGKKPVFSQTVPVTVGTPTVSPAGTATYGGTFHWIANYSGDPGNLAVSGKCGDPGETSVVGGSTPPGQPKPGAKCDANAMANNLLKGLVAALTGTPGASFQATCSAGLRIVLRAKEIRPGNPGSPRHDGFTTMANTLTHSNNNGQLAFGFNPQGLALRDYARSKGKSLFVFAIVHVRPDHTTTSAEALQIFSLK